MTYSKQRNKQIDDENKVSAADVLDSGSVKLADGWEYVDGLMTSTEKIKKHMSTKK